MLKFLNRNSVLGCNPLGAGCSNKLLKSVLSNIFTKAKFSIETNYRNAHPLTDKFGRLHTYLRISLTEKCNLRCTYCMPEEGVPLTPSEKLLTQAEIFRIAKIFAENGVEKIRLTGGEPTIRRDLVEIVEYLSKLNGIKEVGITSNGIVLARKLDALIKAGLTHINVSLDTLNSNKYAIMTRRNGFDKVIRLIDLAEVSLKTQLKINCVVIRGINDEEINEFVLMTKEKNVDVRFIEYMPFGGNCFESRKMISYKEMLKQIGGQFPDVIRLGDPLNSTSKAYKVPGFKGQFGFITSMSEHFCATCNRIRITADGNLKVCLHGAAEVSLRDKLRSGATNAEIVDFISHALHRKKAQHAGMENLMKMTNRPMILIGVNVSTQLKAFMFALCNTVFNNFKFYTTISQFPRMLRHKKYSRHFLECTTPFKQSFQTFSTHHYNEETTIENKTLSHLDVRGRASMVDVSYKLPTLRIAMASATVEFPNATFTKIFDLTQNKDDDHRPDVWRKKGDIFSAARIAGICAAKQTSALIPLCHNVSLSHVEIRFQISTRSSQIHILSRAKCKADTGVEMEALTACTIAALTLYDMCKALSHEITINEIKLLGKSGGKIDIGSVEWPAKNSRDENWL